MVVGDGVGVGVVQGVLAVSQTPAARCNELKVAANMALLLPSGPAPASRLEGVGGEGWRVPAGRGQG